MRRTYEEFCRHFVPQENGKPPLLRELQLKAYERFQALGFPARRMEEWKYINLFPILRTSFEPTDSPCRTPAGSLIEKISSVPDGFRFVFLNGLFIPGLSHNASRPFQVLPLSQALKSEAEFLRPLLVRDLEDETNPFAAINGFQFRDGLFLSIKKETALERPMEILSLGSAEDVGPQVFYPRIVVVLEEGAKAELVLNEAALSPSAYFSNAVIEVYLARDARLHLVSVKQASPQAFYFQTLRGALKEGGGLEAVFVDQEGAKVRNDLRVNFEGSDAVCRLQGLGVVDGATQLFDHVQVNHKVPRCASRQIFKNIVSGSALTEFNSLAHVYRDASKSDSYQLNKNLLMSEEARAYSRPQLKIYTDDVKANHGAANGRMEQTELFYLESRGLSKQVARTLLTFGFAEEILAEIQIASVRIKFQAILRRKLQGLVEKSSAAEKSAWTVV